MSSRGADGSRGDTSPCVAESSRLPECSLGAVSSRGTLGSLGGLTFVGDLASGDLSAGDLSAGDLSFECLSRDGCWLIMSSRG